MAAILAAVQAASAGTDVDPAASHAADGKAAWIAAGRSCRKSLLVLETVLGFWAKCVGYIAAAEAAMADQLRPVDNFRNATAFMETCLLLQPLLVPLTAHLTRGTPDRPGGAPTLMRQTYLKPACQQAML
jgi:hypothetical protein